MERIDPKRLDHYQAKHDTFRMLKVPSQQYLMIDGHGDPNTDRSFADAVATLYPIAYDLKFQGKRELEVDVVVGPLEGLWWAEDMDSFTRTRDKSRWDWTLLLLAPEWVDAERFDTARAKAASKNAPVPDAVRLESLDEGLCVQALHIGSYDDEAELLHRLHHEFVPSHGLTLRGTHHEIYLSDARRVPVERRKAILRQPVARVG